MLDELAPLLDLPDDLDEVAILTDYAVASRYPGAVEPIEEPEHRQALVLARRTLTWAESVIARL